MKLQQVVYDWEIREFPYKKDLIFNKGFNSWDEFRFCNFEDKIGNLVKNQIYRLIDYEDEFFETIFDYNMLLKSCFAPFEKWNLHNSCLKLSSITQAYFNVNKYNLWTDAYQNSVNRMFAGQQITLIGVYSSKLDKVMIVDGTESLIAYLRMLAYGYTPNNCKILMQTVDLCLEDLFFEIYSN